MGAAVETAVGVALRVAVGADVGTSVGAAVGAAVGASVASVGDAVGDCCCTGSGDSCRSAGDTVVGTVVEAAVQAWYTINMVRQEQ